MCSAALTTNESLLFGNLLDFGMNNGTTVPSELIVSNVPYASYDVYFYIWNDTSATNRPAEFIIDGNTQYRINNASYPVQPANNGTGYVIAAPQPGSLPASIVNVPYGNVVKFSGVTDSNLTRADRGGRPGSDRRCQRRHPRPPGGISNCRIARRSECDDHLSLTNERAGAVAGKPDDLRPDVTGEFQQRNAGRQHHRYAFCRG